MNRMKLLAFSFLLVASMISMSMAQEYLPDSIAIQIVDEYRRVTGLPPSGFATMSEPPCDDELCHPRCGTSAVLNFLGQRELIDPRFLRGTNAADPLRPDLPSSFLSPGGFFTIHYTTSGNDAVYQSNVDSDGDGVPDYVESVARIADSVYNFEVITLGYPKPPVDTGVIEGGDARYDIYLRNLSSGIFGLTYSDPESHNIPGDFVATSYLVLENDYADFERYKNRPLDAIRVTTAHEYFHAIQFGIDIGEFDNTGGIQRRYWMEMSAVWMEEQVYDDINDYYTYIDRSGFLLSPRRSLQEFTGTDPFRPYAAVLFPLYLSERFGQGIIKRIWTECGLIGPNALDAINRAIFISSGVDSMSLATALAEFATWNYFTGQYASAAPTGIGYEEGSDFPEIPENQFIQVSNLPFVTLPTDTQLRPQYNASTYIRFEELQNLDVKTIAANRTTICFAVDSVGQCVDSLTLLFRIDENSFCTAVDNFGACTDTVTLIDDTTIQCFNGPGGEDCTGTVRVNDLDLTKVLSIFGLLGQPADSFVQWGISTIYQLENKLDSHRVEFFTLPSFTNLAIEFARPDSFRSITLVLAPATINRLLYSQQLPNSSILRFALGNSFDTTGIESELISRPSSVLYPYPNPAVVHSMGTAPISFRFEGPTNSATFPEYASAFLSIDIYTSSGDYVATSSFTTPMQDRLGVYRYAEYTATWDMNNQDGEPVAGGVYLAVAKLYVDASRKDLLAEAKQKLLIVR